jgi:hypothetical protein
MAAVQPEPWLRALITNNNKNNNNIRTLAIFTAYKITASRRQDCTLSSGETGKGREQNLLG